MNTKRALLLLWMLPALLFSLTGCSEGNPVAPTGSTLTLTANPSTISATGTSTITIVGRKPDGNPFASGTEVSLSTNIGSIDALVSTNNQGVATATFRGDGRSETATITATTVAGDAMGTVDISIQGASLTLSASPTRITVNGTSTITVDARRGDGQPLEAGTEISFSTTLGTINRTATTNGDGQATATLRADGRSGTATVTAATVAGEGEGTIDVAIGINAGSVTLQATPSSIGDTGGEISLLAIVRDDEGSPLGGANANFTTEIGRLDSGGAIVVSNSAGEARDVLRANEAELDTIVASSFNVEVVVSGAGNALVRDTFAIRIESSLTAGFTVSPGGGEFGVFFDNETVGFGDITYQWDFTDDGVFDSTETNPTHDYGNAGSFTVRLRATAKFDDGTEEVDDEVQTITVPVT